MLRAIAIQRRKDKHCSIAVAKTVENDCDKSASRIAKGNPTAEAIEDAHDGRGKKRHQGSPSSGVRAPAPRRGVLALPDQLPRRRRLADGCHHVYLALDANIGVHSRFLFGPSQYPDAKLGQGKGQPRQRILHVALARGRRAPGRRRRHRQTACVWRIPSDTTMVASSLDRIRSMAFLAI